MSVVCHSLPLLTQTRRRHRLRSFIMPANYYSASNSSSSYTSCFGPSASALIPESVCQGADANPNQNVMTGNCGLACDYCSSCVSFTIVKQFNNQADTWTCHLSNKAVYAFIPSSVSPCVPITRACCFAASELTLMRSAPVPSHLAPGRSAISTKMCPMPRRRRRFSPMSNQISVRRSRPVLGAPARISTMGLGSGTCAR